MIDLALIKLRGSLITDKDKPYTARPEIIEQLAREVSAIANQNPHLKLIIGNGAGSFGHQSKQRAENWKKIFKPEYNNKPVARSPSS